ncbi:MAG: adenine phosphoribosyltransferase [Candidatus Omnitrophica bacterium CG11_big_fil_rev_8_21_14_0_20_42_13]|uniref:Adenine phosphoribosyltransferase n=1 Tax=Candidatus Ghiorseimicrobium undicola TaxID=1974746 RepID=A0A2H0LYP3_9BACT|nr:MAG: adenine phosphoribosyltransferase [Candidatus Omnitrophica bacterium CG11_big_fil_rev_8_21_14_0_20_42_13]
MDIEQLKNSIRAIPDFPKKGILFRDITTLLSDKEAFKAAIDMLYDYYKDKKIDCVVGIESRGFILGSVLAYKLGCGFVPVRKKNKLPYKTHSITYSLEYGTDTLEIHEDAFAKGARILIVDDLLATGGTVAAVCDLVKKISSDIVGICFLIELTALSGRDKLKGLPVFSLIKF